MAKKKVTQHPQNQDQQIHQAAMEETSEKLENLKSLNAMLLKETVERRQQVDSLQISNGSLECELTRSKMEKKVLQAELIQLSDETVLMELQKSVVCVFVKVQVTEKAEIIAKERDGFVKERIKIEKKLGGLEREMREAMREKSEIEKMKREKENESGFLKKRLSEVAVEIGNEKKISGSVSQERDEIRTRFDAQVEETDRLRVKLTQMEKKERLIEEVVCKLKGECKSLVEEKEERERRLESMKRDTESIERCLVESNRVIEEMKREIGETVREKEVIAEEKNLEVVKRTELESEVSQLEEMVLSLQKEEERLRGSIIVLEKECGEGIEKEKETVKKIDTLVKEKEEREKNFKKLSEEKGLIVKDLNQVMKQLGEQKKIVEAMSREKIEVEKAKGNDEKEIVELKKELGKFKSNILSLEESCKVQIGRIKELESKVNQYRDEFDCVKIERDEAKEGFKKEKMYGMSLREKMLQIEKNLEETKKVVTEMKNENGNLVGEKKELENQCSVLMNDIALVGEKLAKAQKEFDDVKAKTTIADANSELILNLLRSTANLVSVSKDESVVLNEKGFDELKDKEEMKPFVAELEAIKNAFNSREVKVEDMKREVEFLKDSVTVAHKKKSFWTLVSSATTILAAASVAYVARGH
ncbi:hypothetical protein LguiB_024215 [Lonicera macranthoides]